jgi:hypothetical protein
VSSDAHNDEQRQGVECRFKTVSSMATMAGEKKNRMIRSAAAHGRPAAGALVGT